MNSCGYRFGAFLEGYSTATWASFEGHLGMMLRSSRYQVMLCHDILCLAMLYYGHLGTVYKM